MAANWQKLKVALLRSGSSPVWVVLIIGIVLASLAYRTADLRIQHLSQPAEPGPRLPYGQSYTIRAILKGPSGEAAAVVSVWFIRSTSAVPHFVTAYPGGDQ